MTFRPQAMLAIEHASFLSLYHESVRAAAITRLEDALRSSEGGH